MRKAEVLRRTYPHFFYSGYSWKLKGKNLHISFDFSLPPHIKFHPEVRIQNVSRKNLERVGEKVLRNLVFHLGLMEIPSYWKATCAPEIIIRAGYLNEEQIAWWKDLMLKGMGEFFYQNKINFSRPDFFHIRIFAPFQDEIFRYEEELSEKILVPIGGGKDGLVSWELLKKSKKKIAPFVLNPTNTQYQILKVLGKKPPVIVHRRIDPTLLQLNRRGYLNGHTPFSAYLAFLSAFTAVLFDFRYVAISNERSSNEGNVRYRGRMINHQYSKTFEFEKKFREYSKEYLARDLEYFSFLRPLYELQITKIFAKYPNYLPVFMSCNEAYKTKSGTQKPTGQWCGNCPKCLFVFTALFPFVEEKQLKKIFKKNVFEDRTLLPLMKELVGERKFKPFECVGTIKESLAAFYGSYAKFLQSENSHRTHHLPPLMRYFKEKILPKHPNLKKESARIFNAWNAQHFVPMRLVKILLEAIDKNDKKITRNT